ncbi:MAG: DUF1611 domain-containing protein [Bacteroidia bacterium]
MLSNAIKTAYTCRNITVAGIDSTRNMTRIPHAGDMALFEVLTLGKHVRIQDDQGNHRSIMPGDHLMLAFGHRYASAQFEGYVPEAPLEVYHLLGQGGVVGEVRSAHASYRAAGPTTLRLIGYAFDETGAFINTHYRAEMRPTLGPVAAHTILSVGTSMDSGKTTTAAYLCRGFSRAGKRVAFIKLTGTCYSKDAQLSLDLGAAMSIDFSHFGYPSTYMCSTEELTRLFYELVSVVQQAVQPEVILIEIADGLLQRETAALLQHQPFMRAIDDVVFSSGDSLGLLGGLHVLQHYNIQPRALSGLLTASPLMVQEARALSTLPVLHLHECEDPAVVMETFSLRATARTATPLPMMPATVAA